MVNLTVKVDQDLLRQVRIKALTEGTSVNRVVDDALRAFVGNTPSASAWRFFLDGARRSSARSPAGRDWTREELYER